LNTTTNNIESKDFPQVDAHLDLILMASCKNFVIANSSLSWWGAWLGSRQGKIVVAPRQWFKGGTNTIEDLIPPNWISIG
jgi:hypothetical protein